MKNTLASIDGIIAQLEKDGLYAEAAQLDGAFIRIAEDAELTDEEKEREETGANHPGEPKRKD
jgi:hypothetical protein